MGGGSPPGVWWVGSSARGSFMSSISCPITSRIPCRSSSSGPAGSRSWGPGSPGGGGGSSPRWGGAGRRDLLDLGPALRRGPLCPWLPPNRRSDVRVRSAAGSNHRAACVCRFGHRAVPPQHALARADAYFRGLTDLPFDPNLHVGSFSFAWHSIFSLVGMIAGSIVSFRAARYLIRDDRIYPFAIAVVIGGLVGAPGAHVLGNWDVYPPRPPDVLAFLDGAVRTAPAPPRWSLSPAF